jgi:hypothetical protein
LLGPPEDEADDLARARILAKERVKADARAARSVLPVFKRFKLKPMGRLNTRPV